MKVNYISFSLLVITLLGSSLWSAEMGARQILEFGIVPKQVLNVALLKSEALGQGKQALRKDTYLLSVKSNSSMVLWQVKSDASSKKQLQFKDDKGKHPDKIDNTIMSGHKGQFEKVVECISEATDGERVNFYLVKS